MSKDDSTLPPFPSTGIVYVERWDVFQGKMFAVRASELVMGRNISVPWNKSPTGSLSLSTEDNFACGDQHRSLL